jgi:hypothetical protein
VPISKRLLRLLTAPAHWVALLLAAVMLVLQGLGVLGAAGIVLALIGYVAGWAVGGMWLGLPSMRGDDWERLDFDDDGGARAAMERALRGIGQLAKDNPGERMPAKLQARVLELCRRLEELLQQWEASKGSLSLQESFHARHIAISYLPEALNTFLSIPARYASSKVLDNGQTAVQILDHTLDDLEGKVKQLGDDLASQDAHAFLVHSEFLRRKFASATADEPPLPRKESAS